MNEEQLYQDHQASIFVDELVEGVQPVHLALHRVVRNGDSELSLTTAVQQLYYQHLLSYLESCPKLGSCVFLHLETLY